MALLPSHKLYVRPCAERYGTVHRYTSSAVGPTQEEESSEAAKALYTPAEDPGTRQTHRSTMQC
jgi:hypothetical protein